MSTTCISSREEGRYTMKKLTLFRTFPVMLLGIVLGAWITPAFAVDASGVFELDGNADQDVAPLPDDWETLHAGGGSPTTFVFITDKNGLDNIFTGGGSKTPKDPEDWLWKSSPPPPDKDNITHAYAANYMHLGEQIVYFGADLFADNGDAELAFWFFQSTVGTNGLGGFDGHHMDEDVYVAVKFSNGGTKANITVYEWWSACNKGVKNPGAGDCAADNIRVVIPEGPALCTGSGGVACAITNGDYENSPWPYTPKGGNPGDDFPPTTFFEGGINIFEAFGENKCFSSFMVTTGASTSFTSTAKDFALGEFDVCSVDVSKTCVNDSEDDDAPTLITYNIRGCGINDGGAPVNLTTLLNAIGGDTQYTPTDLTWYLPGQVDDGGLRDFDPATDCNDVGLLKQAVDNGSVVNDLANTDVMANEALVYQFSETTSLNGPSDTVTLDAIGTDGSDIDDDTASATCPLRTFSASLNVTKQCAADLEVSGSNLVVVINVQGQVCNTGEVRLTGLVLVDNVAHPASGPVTLIPLSTTLEPIGDSGGNDCTSYSGYYYPSSIPTGNVCPFADVVTASALAPVNSAGNGCILLGNGTSECTVDSNSATCELRVQDTDNDCSTGLLSVLP